MQPFGPLGVQSAIGLLVLWLEYSYVLLCECGERWVWLCVCASVSEGCTTQFYAMVQCDSTRDMLPHFSQQYYENKATVTMIIMKLHNHLCAIVDV